MRTKEEVDISLQSRLMKEIVAQLDAMSESLNVEPLLKDEDLSQDSKQALQDLAAKIMEQLAKVKSVLLQDSSDFKQFEEEYQPLSRDYEAFLGMKRELQNQQLDARSERLGLSF